MGGLSDPACFIKDIWLPADSELCRLEEPGFAAGAQLPFPDASFGCKRWPFPLRHPGQLLQGTTHCPAVCRPDGASRRCKPRLGGQSRGKAALSLLLSLVGGLAGSDRHPSVSIDQAT